ncbi:Unknown protein sequence [Pseudomonas syringae pv. cilantro]|uniref:Uncharacterized protein n=1 Tax=Pseudomonas syringae pv. cilantro TaxID=81035 RepID=A0A0N0GG72_PSESX|nr:Unknown protein sequence [Pseudomonas syringae pv. cilantro]
MGCEAALKQVISAVPVGPHVLALLQVPGSSRTCGSGLVHED